ncbi:MAG: hypothetical protein BGP24_13320 [Lysobacterales bacterium 69-70]|nr:hypothetical protein [Xanthomonadaceae bacterium]ODU31158.1 MAG: hypothetical protein ABS97_23080 [Xanthomonadaceae bacterium SCN 69-320]ODV22641.1 MAG: hypothetical protein ABT27_00835 [Xanthomonadaceae bacterium SCN 69-25]OJY98747.1 MAG: hypothetical protein BGP24_13320 [Xanthomonadales bacterium 69-70]
MRLVLDNGYVLRLNADGSAFDGEFGKLALRGGQRIHAIEPDYATGRLYVTLDGPPPNYLTQVHDLASLELLDSLDGVVAVYVPDERKARTVLMRRYQRRDDRGYTNASLMPEELAISGDLQWQRRDRRHPAKVLTAGPDEANLALPRCDLGGSLPFLTANPYWRLDRHFAPASLPGFKAARERIPQSRQWRVVQACLDDGQTLETVGDMDPQSREPEALYKVSALERRRGEQVFARYETPATLLPVAAEQEARRLGHDGRRIALIGLGVVLDLTEGTLVNARIAGPPWLTRSADGETLYGLPRHYVYRSIATDNYLVGSSPVFTGGVDRLSVAGGHVRRDKLPLPAELQDLLAQQDAQSRAFRERLERLGSADTEPSADGDGTDAETAVPEETEPALTPLQQRLGQWITIIGVLDD